MTTTFIDLEKISKHVSVTFTESANAGRGSSYICALVQGEDGRVLGDWYQYEQPQWEGEYLRIPIKVPYPVKNSDGHTEFVTVDLSVYLTFYTHGSCLYMTYRRAGLACPAEINYYFQQRERTRQAPFREGVTRPMVCSKRLRKMIDNRENPNSDEYEGIFVWEDPEVKWDTPVEMEPASFHTFDHNI